VPGNRDFQEFYEASYGRIVALVAAMLLNRHEAQDIAQEAFARALARWPRIAGYDLPEAWVRRVAIRLAADSGRRLRRTARVSERLASARRGSDPEPADALALTPLGCALRRVPLRQREVLVLHYLADLPVEVISRDFGMPSGTVKSRLAAGRRRLEAELARSHQAVRDAR
jgi:RNA polymerase sigma-70 factor (ECF subfamily)